MSSASDYEGLVVWGPDQASAAIRSWTPLLNFVRPELVPARTLLFRQGSLPQAVFFVERGLVMLSHLTAEGDDVALGLRFAGQFVEYAAAILCRVYNVSASTASETVFDRVPVATFLDVIHQSEGAAVLQSTAAIDMLQATTQLVSSKADSADRRFERLISELAAHQGERIPGTMHTEIRVCVPLSNAELAALICVTPEHFSRLKRRLANEGRFRQAGRMITLISHQQR